MTTLYLIHVNGIPYAEGIDEENKNYQLQVLSQYEELKVLVTAVQVEGVKWDETPQVRSQESDRN